MNDQFESKMTNSGVSKLRNSPAITFVSRLDLDHFACSNFIGQLDSPSFIQRIPNQYSENIYTGEHYVGY